MSARTFMPLYVGDYLKDTLRFDAELNGAYMFLIMEYWQHGGLPDTDDQLCRIARVKPRRWPYVRAALAPYFGPGWTHRRIDAEIQKADEAYARRANAGRKGGSQKSSNATAMLAENPSNATAMLKHNQNQNASHIPIQEGAYPSNVKLNVEELGSAPANVVRLGGRS